MDKTLLKTVDWFLWNVLKIMSFYEYFFKFVNVKVKKSAAWGVELDPTKPMKYLKQNTLYSWTSNNQSQTVGINY